MIRTWDDPQSSRKWDNPTKLRETGTTQPLTGTPVDPGRSRVAARVWRAGPRGLTRGVGVGLYVGL